MILTNSVPLESEIPQQRSACTYNYATPALIQVKFLAQGNEIFLPKHFLWRQRR